MTSNAEQGEWYRRMQVAAEDHDHEEADGIIREIALTTGHRAIVDIYDTVFRCFDFTEKD